MDCWLCSLVVITGAGSGVFFIPRKDGRPGTTWDHVSNPVGLKLIVSNPEEEEPNFKDM